ncbi:hypothetical protein X777_03489 [Ooceraea biroi]|uniref:Uncharacterized protein n=1 Tax=Ooceraea biroi TaxID=2015173 RepID=A0A026WJE3_OOCBI|nr:hypothetical protein X777_03489 [Ooceraea biroi]
MNRWRTLRVDEMARKTSGTLAHRQAAVKISYGVGIKGVGPELREGGTLSWPGVSPPWQGGGEEGHEIFTPWYKRARRVPGGLNLLLAFNGVCKLYSKKGEIRARRVQERGEDRARKRDGKKRRVKDEG